MGIRIGKIRKYLALVGDAPAADVKDPYEQLELDFGNSEVTDKEGDGNGEG